MQAHFSQTPKSRFDWIYSTHSPCCSNPIVLCAVHWARLHKCGVFCIQYGNICSKNAFITKEPSLSADSHNLKKDEYGLPLLVNPYYRSLTRILIREKLYTHSDIPHAKECVDMSDCLMIDKDVSMMIKVEKEGRTVEMCLDECIQVFWTHILTAPFQRCNDNALL